MRKASSVRLRARSTFLLLAALSGAYAFCVEPAWLAVSVHEMSAGAGPLGVRVVHLSDLHLRDFGTREQRVIETVHALAPALVVMTGDSIDTPDGGHALRRFLDALAPVPAVAVPGNWEYWAGWDVAELRELHDAAGVALLVNETARFTFGGFQLVVIGLDDHSGGKPSPPPAFVAPDADPIVLVLQHSPGWFDQPEAAAAVPADTDLCLAGHTHAGQITLFGLPLWMPPGSGDYVAGWYETPRCRLYVSRGIGTSLLPARFGARPEIAVFDF